MEAVSRPHACACRLARAVRASDSGGGRRVSGWSWGWIRGRGASAPSLTWQAVWAIRLKVARDRASSARATVYTPGPPAPVTACSPLDARDASARGQSDTQRDAPLSSSSSWSSSAAASASTSPPAAAVPPQATPQATPPRRRQSSPPRPSPPRTPPAALAARGGNVSAASAPAASSPLRVPTPSKGAPPAPTPLAPEPSPRPRPSPTPKLGVRGVRALPAQSSACEELDHPTPRHCHPNRPSPRRSTWPTLRRSARPAAHPRPAS